MENLLHSINFELSLSDSNEAVGKLNRRKSENFKTSRKRDDDKPLLVKNIGVRFVNDDLDQSDEELSTLSQQRSLITGVVQPKTLYEEEEQQYQSAQKIMKRSRSEMIFYKGLPKERENIRSVSFQTLTMKKDIKEDNPTNKKEENIPVTYRKFKMT